ncbi:phosphatidylinositol-glycan biosynthesis class W protein-like isoform X2 [Acanthaster planci]|uniref:Phosphatidylinositol-glycan biosynthesis class W protein n=1 Tax=Acanthaster planci TaxID=133434 RepID=A0A8B7Y6D6_ACAPL|nr:phosphatidylinositol-glycan biosynthesis class W protein-like isoform X2 [Acanthaster planci]
MASRNAKEAFYTNLTGTTPFEVSLAVAVGPASELLRWTLLPILFMVFGNVIRNKWLSFSLDFVTLVIPLLLAFTVWNGSLQRFLISLVVTSATLLVVAYLLQPVRSQRVKRPSKAKAVAAPRPLWELPMESEQLVFMTMFRVHGIVASAITILAVDFPVFPRRFAKTETYGTGMMDIGVGAFMFMNALVSKEARGVHQNIFSGVTGALKSLTKTVISALPMVILGMVRLASVKSSGYHEHVSEYGVHWNFFFTLAVVIIVSSVCLLVIPPVLSGPLALAIAVGYQHLLSNRGLGQFVLAGSDGQGSREGLLDANREGLVSCVGYLAIYLAGVWTGRFLLKRRTLFFDWWLAFLLLVVINVLLWIFLEASSVYIQPVCRRMANLPYIIWTLCFCIQLLASYMLVDIVLALGKEFIWKSPFKISSSKSGKHPLLPESVLVAALRPNLLLVFLLCNLLTGVVNLSLDTIGQPMPASMAVLVLYMLGLCLVAFGLHTRGIKLKFW